MSTKKIGVVTSIKNDKTINVSVLRKFKHPKYKKIVILKKSYKAHDELNCCKCGNIVIIEICSPYSRTKSWCLKKIIS